MIHNGVTFGSTVSASLKFDIKDKFRLLLPIFITPRLRSIILPYVLVFISFIFANIRQPGEGGLSHPFTHRHVVDTAFRVPTMSQHRMVKLRGELRCEQQMQPSCIAHMSLQVMKEASRTQ